MQSTSPSPPSAGGSGQYAKLCMVFEPNPGEGFEFTNNIIGGAVPKEYVPAVIKGTEGSLSNGIRMGFPVVDVKASLKDSRAKVWSLGNWGKLENQ